VDDRSWSLLIWFAVTAGFSIYVYVRTKGSWIATAITALLMLGIGYAVGVLA
jgi:hypothetical protein